MTIAQFDTRYESDKIVAVLEGSYNASTYNSILGGYLYQKNIPHSFGRPVFCDALFSDNNTNFVPNGNSTPDNAMKLQVYSDTSNIYILNSANTGTVYYKIICTWIDNYDNTNPIISTVLQSNPKEYFDSRFNYQKVFKSGMLTEYNPTPVEGTDEVPHNLNYLPNVKVYFESLPNQVWPTINGGSNDFWLYDAGHQFELFYYIRGDNLVFFYSGVSTSAPTFRIWYRIYLDK